jgi:hypothetical protein
VLVLQKNECVCEQQAAAPIIRKEAEMSLISEVYRARHTVSELLISIPSDIDLNNS